MPADYTIIAERGVVIVRQWGHLMVADARAAFEDFQRDPKGRPGLTNLCDCSGITSYEKDFAAILGLQAQIADTYRADLPETLLVLYGPFGPPLEVAQIIHRSWEKSGFVHPRLATTEAEALAIAGMSETRIADLRALA